jgi:hypothetical protein
VRCTECKGTLSAMVGRGCAGCDASWSPVKWCICRRPCALCGATPEEPPLRHDPCHGPCRQPVCHRCTEWDSGGCTCCKRCIRVARGAGREGEGVGGGGGGVLNQIAPPGSSSTVFSPLFSSSAPLPPFPTRIPSAVPAPTVVFAPVGVAPAAASSFAPHPPSPAPTAHKHASLAA